MSDQTPDPHDDLLRDALQAEAEGVTADADLLARIHAAAAQPSGRRIVPWLLVAAAVALVAGLGVTLLNQDDDQVVDSANDPSSTTTVDPTTSTVPPEFGWDVPIEFPCEVGEELDLAVYLQPDTSQADIDAMGALLSADERVASQRFVDQEAVYALFEIRFADSPQLLATVTPEILPVPYLIGLVDPSTETDLRSELADRPEVHTLADVGCAESTSPDVVRPAVAVAVTKDGRVVVIDVGSGAELRELAALADPTATTAAGLEIAPNTISGVALHPNGRDVYYETCCEPASGAVYRVPIDGSAEPTQITGAYGIDISADGRWLVGVSGGVGVIVYEIDAGTGTLVQDEGAFEWEQVAVNADGTEVSVLAANRDDNGTVLARVVERYAVADGELGPRLGTTESAEAIAPLYTSDTRRPGVVSTFGALDVNVDASGGWVLRVDSQGYLGFAVQGSQSIVISDGLFLAADW